SRSSKELSAGGFGCGNDLVEAFVTAQRIPARIEKEIAVCDCIMPDSRKGRDFFELLERAVVLAGPRVNQRQIGNQRWTVERVLGNRHEFDRLPCLADRLFFASKSSIKFCNAREVVRILGFVALLGFQLLARRCKRGHCLPLIAARTRNLPAEGVIITRRSSGNHPICRVVIAQVKDGLKSYVPNPSARTILRQHLIYKRL